LPAEPPHAKPNVVRFVPAKYVKKTRVVCPKDIIGTKLVFESKKAIVIGVLLPSYSFFGIEEP
jgi:hypothetical protein